MKNIVYGLEVQNNSKQTFDEVQKDTQETGKGVKSLSEAFKDIGKGFSKGVKEELKGVGDEVGKLHKKHFTLASLFKDVIGKMIDLAATAIKAQIALALIGITLSNLDRLTEAVGGSTTRLGRAMISVGDFLKSAWAKLGAAASEGRERILKSFPIINELIKLAKGIAMAFNAPMALGHKEFRDIIKLVGITNKTIDDLGMFALRSANKIGVAVNSSIELKQALLAVRTAADRITQSLPAFDRFTATMNKASASVIDFWKKTEKARNRFVSFGSFVINVGSKIIATIMRHPVASAAAAASIVGLVIAWKDLNKTIQELDALDENARRVGFSISAYKAWDNEFKKAGTSMQEQERIISGLSSKVLDIASGTGKAAKSFKELGIKVTDSNGYLKSNQQVFTEVISRLSQMGDKNLRNAYVFEIFGDRARNIIPILDEYNGRVSQTIKDAEKNEKLYRTAAEASSRYSDTLADMKNAFDIEKTKIYTALIQRLGDSLEILANSRIGVVLAGIGIVLARTAAVIIDVVNTIVASIDALFSGLVTGITMAVHTVYDSYTQIIRFINSTPIGKKIISDEDVANAQAKTDEVANYMIKSWEKAKKANQLAIKSSDQLWSLGANLPGNGGNTDSTGATPPKRDGDTKAQTLIAKFNEWRINNIQNTWKREIALIKVEYNNRLTEINNGEKEGLVTAKQAAAARLSIATWQKNEILRIQQEEFQARSEAYKASIDEAMDLMADGYQKEQDILRQFASQSTYLIPNKTVRARAQLDLEYTDKTKENTAIMNSGDPGMYEAAMKNQLAIDKWYEEEKRQISIEGTAAYIENVKKRQDAEKKAIDKIIDVYDGMFSTMNQGWSLVSNIMSEAGNATANSFTAILDGLDVISSRFESTMNVLRDSSLSVGQKVSEVVAVVGAAINTTISSLVAKTNESAINSVDKWYTKEKQRIDESVMGHRRRQRMLTQLEEQKVKKEEEIKKKAFERNKIASIMQAIINTAVAITMAFAQLGPIAGGIMAGVVGALGVAQIGIIAAQKYAKGGIVPGTGNKDTEPAMLTPGEMILNKRQQAELFNMANGRRSGASPNISISGDNIVINGSVTQDTLDKLEERDIANQRKMVAILKEAQYNGLIKFAY